MTNEDIQHCVIAVSLCEVHAATLRLDKAQLEMK